MEGHTIEEAAILLKQSADFLRNKILFSGKPDPILKPCVFFHHPRSFRVVNVCGQSSTPSIECLPKQVAFDVGNGRRRNYSYSSVNIQGLFELTFFPDNFDMTEAKESGYIQLYKEKAVFAGYLAEFSIDMAVGWIMSGWKDFDEIHNRWHAMTSSEASSTKSRVRSKIGQFIILSQNGIHYLVDSPASISLSDICITDNMLTEYAASMGIVLKEQQPQVSVRPARHKILPDEHKAKSKSAIQLAVEAFLDSTPEGNKHDFYRFLKQQLELPEKTILKNGQSYPYYFKDVKVKGNLEGVYLNHPKEKKKEGDPSWNHYTGNAVSGIIAKEKGRRNKTGI